VTAYRIAPLRLRRDEISERAKRDRPAKNPGGMVCEECSEVFIGEDWHVYCAICIEAVAKRIAEKQYGTNG